MSYSEENGIHKGLGIIDGKVTLFKRKPINLKIPHMPMPRFWQGVYLCFT